MLYSKIHTYILENGIRQTAIANKVGVSTQAFYDMMNGRRKIIIEEYVKICKALNLPVTYFLDDKNITA